MKTALRIFAHPFTWGLIALSVLLTELTPWVYPGEAATLMAHLTGVWHTSATVVSAHQLVSLLFGALGRILPVSVAIPTFNILAAITGALCVVLICQLIRHVTYYLADEPRTLPSVPRAAAIAMPFAGATLLFSPAFLRAATHFQWQIFDLFFILGLFLMLFRVAQRPTTMGMAITAFMWGLITFEAPACLVLTPLFMLGLAIAYYAAQERIRLMPFVAYLATPFALGMVLTITTPVLQQLTLAPNTTFITALISQGVARYSALMNLLNGPWILILFTGILPAFLTFFLLKDIGKNRRTPAILFTFIATVTIAILALVPGSLSLETLTTQANNPYPVLLAALTAFALAGLIAAALLFISVHRRAEAAEERAFVRPMCRIAGWAALAVLPISLIIAGVTITLPSRLAEKPYASLPLTYADTLLKDCNTEMWLLSDGVADAYLALRIAQRELPIVLFSLTQDRETRAQNALIERLQHSPYFTQKPELSETLTRSIEIGLIPFIQDWLRADPTAEQLFATLGLPDLWYTGNRLPLPQGLWYRGVADRATQHAQLALPALDEMKLDTTPYPETLNSSLKTFAEYVKRQQSFILNNTAFYLADAGKLEEAYTLFRKVYDFYPDNVSALFNTFELINGGLHPEDKAWCEKEISELIRHMRGRRYQLWALARTYGYIRSPQLMSMLAGSWAMSGQTGAALSGMDIALAMLDDGKRGAFNQLVANLYKTDPHRRGDAIQKYQQLLATSTDQRQSLIYVREIVRMNILENDLQAAKAALEQVDPMGDSPELAYERALWFSAAGQPERTRAEVERCLETNPRHLEALTMLATLQLQAGEETALTSETLTKLKTAAGTEDNYFVQIITAQLAEHKNDLKKARTAYLRALALKPEVRTLRNTVLILDIRLNDKAAAAKHAKDFLYQDRELPLANYIIGSLALGEGDPKRALSYLTQATASTAEHPIPEAFNDLAEAHRQLGDWSAALSAAEHACKLAPNLAIARETAAAALLELGRYAEAHNYLAEAFDLEAKRNPGQDPDPRLLITRARLHAKEGNPGLARIDLATARPQYESLDRKAKAEFDALMQEVR